jgi:hypothetical protein
MSFLLKIDSKIRLKIGVFALVFGLLALVFMDYFDLGFLGGFVTGLLLGIGVGFIATHRKVNRN